MIAGAGLPVAKHGSRAATSRCGSADVLQALGVNTAAPLETVERCLNEHEICFMFAPLFHAATARVAHVRRELGVHTTFNLLGPLTNPARAPFQIVGVWHRSLLERVASALARLGVEKAWVVHGADGLDEITIADKTYVAATFVHWRSGNIYTVARRLWIGTSTLRWISWEGPAGKRPTYPRNFARRENENNKCRARSRHH